MSGRAKYVRPSVYGHPISPPRRRGWMIGGRLALTASAVFFLFLFVALALLPPPSRFGSLLPFSTGPKSTAAPAEAQEERIVRLFTSLPLTGRLRHVHVEGATLFVDACTPPDPRIALGDALTLYSAVFTELDTQSLYLRVFVTGTEELYLAIRAPRPASLPRDRQTKDLLTPAGLKALFGPDVGITFGPRWPGVGG